MSDKLFHMPVIGLDLTAVGVSVTTDNHENSVNGRDLNCSDSTKKRLTVEEAYKLHSEIGVSGKADRSMLPDGITEVVTGDGVSPLQRLCTLKNNVTTR
jgi:hypothetical protein